MKFDSPAGANPADRQAVLGRAHVRVDGPLKTTGTCDDGAARHHGALITARSQVIGGMTMGIGAALMEEMTVDTRLGLFVNHGLAGYEVPVHADVPHLDVVFVDEVELGLSGVAPAIANAVYNATGVRVRSYPITLDKHLDRLPAVA